MSRDDAYLLDMLISARLVAQYALGLTEDRFRRSEMHQDAIIRRLEIIGEAARHVSQETRAEHPKVEWDQMTGMRHRLAHDYRNVDLDIVWSVTTAEIPSLIAYLQHIVPPDESET
jgi:uncharacterized protein with HEPN domain